MRAIVLPLFLALLGAAPACPAVAKPAVSAEDPQQAVLLGYARSMIAKGQGEQAIGLYLDPIIARYEAAYPAGTVIIYSSRGLPETMMYMMMAATTKHDAVALGPTWGDAWFLKGFALVDLGRLAEARAAFAKAIGLAPQNATYLAELGNVYQTSKDWPKALETFKRAEAAAGFAPEALKTVETARALRGQGFALTELGRYDESEALYRKCLMLDPGDKIAEGELHYIAGLRAKNKRMPST